MALTLEEEQALESVGLVDFFEDDRKYWYGIALESYDFVRKTYPDGATVRVDDVAKVLLPIVDIDEKLRAMLSKEKLRQKYWRRYFCNLILERCWVDIENSKKQG